MNMFELVEGGIAKTDYDVKGDDLYLERLAGRGGQFTMCSKSMFSGTDNCARRMMRVIRSAIDIYDVGGYVDLDPYVMRVMSQINTMVPDNDRPYLVKVSAEYDNGHGSGRNRVTANFRFQFEFFEPHPLGVRAPTANLLGIAVAYL